eukprot:6546677-Prymnesium_polylepis.1
MLCTCSPRRSPVSQEEESAPQRGKVRVQHPTFSRSHPRKRKQPADPSELLKTFSGAQIEPGATVIDRRDASRK